MHIDVLQLIRTNLSSLHCSVFTTYTYNEGTVFIGDAGCVVSKCNCKKSLVLYLLVLLKSRVINTQMQPIIGYLYAETKACRYSVYHMYHED